MNVRAEAASTFLLALALHPLRAEDASVRSPVLGHMLDTPRGTIRAITGVSGSAALGEPIGGLAGLRRAAISSSHAVAEREGDQSLILIRWAGAVETLPLDGTPSDSPLFVLSPGGTAVAIVIPASEDSGPRIRVITGLPHNPFAGFDVGIQIEPAELAVSDDGTVAVADGSGVVVQDGGAGWRRVFEGETPAIAFRPGSRELAIASPTSRTATLISAGSIRHLGADRLESPYALAFSGDGQRLVIAQDPGSVALIEVETGDVSVVQCDFRPDGLYRLRGGTVFRLSDSAKGAIAVLDADNAEPRIVAIAAFESSTSDSLPGEKQ